jgi:hypothetical protein
MPVRFAVTSQKRSSARRRARLPLGAEPVINRVAKDLSFGSFMLELTLGMTIFVNIQGYRE